MKTIELLSGYGMKIISTVIVSLGMTFSGNLQAAETINPLNGSEGVETTTAKVVNVFNDMLTNTTWWVDFLKTNTKTETSAAELTPEPESEILSNPTFWKNQVDEFVDEDSIFEAMNTSDQYWINYINSHPAE